MADITRAEVASLIGEEYGPQTIKAATQGSTAIAAFPTVSMGTKTRHMPVLATVPDAEWVGDTDNTGVKPTGEATWADKNLVAEEVAVILPIHENTLDDATEDILAQLAELGGQALGKKLDQAVLFGIDKPVSWTSLDLLAAAVASGQAVEAVDGAASESDIYGATLQVAGMVADVGFDPETLIAKRALQYKLANLRDTTGNMILDGDTIRGFETFWSRNGAWDAASAVDFVVDPSTVRIGIRQDVTVKFLDQATVGGINLAEKDMVALRFKARFAYVLGNPATPETGVASYGVGAVTPDITVE
ncbi:phage major capsid protein [Isoptericola halotolerans]|uniref:phage major capsid protein n=1 Tax=Isoptericola halotolerans TaxID=300560 RepID=UPI00388F300E